MTSDLLSLLIFLTSLTVVVAGILGIASLVGHRTLEHRIRRAQRKTASKTPIAASEQLRRAIPTSRAPSLESLVRHLPNIAMLQTRLERTGKSIGVGNYALVNLILFLAVAGPLIGLDHTSSAIAVLSGVTVGLGVPHGVVGFLIGKRMKKFLILFPDALELIVRGLRSGLPVSESIHVVGRELADPVGEIFRGIGNATALGIPLEKALADTASRLALTEFDFFVTSITLQRETGGNLAEILANLADTLRNRVMMRLKIKAYSSEAKASATIVGSLPVLIAVALHFLNPRYLDAFADTSSGNYAAMAGIASFATGIFVMFKMANFEI